MEQAKQHNIITIVRDYGSKLFSFIRGKVNSNEDAEDILQIISGLSESDEVVTGYQQLTKTEAKKKTAASPFMPKRPSGNRKSNPGPPPQ